MDIYSTKICSTTTHPSENARVYEYETNASSEEHAFSKMMGDSLMGPIVISIFGDEVFEKKHKLFVWKRASILAPPNN